MSIPIQTSIPEAIQMVNEVFGLTSLDTIGISSKERDEARYTRTLPAEYDIESDQKEEIRWGTGKWRRVISESLRRAGMDVEANKWDACGNEWIVQRCLLNSNHIYFIPYRCDLRICPRCAWRYARKIRNRYKEVLRDLAKSGAWQRKTLKLMTLTMKNNGDELTPEFIRNFNKKAAKIIRKFFDGGFAVTELGKNFNVHAHCLVFGKFVLQKELSKAWHQLTGDSMVVDIRRVKEGKIPLDYLLKYISKPCQFDHSEAWVHYIKAISGTRRVRSYGILYNMDQKEPERRGMDCPDCGGPLRYDREWSRRFDFKTLRQVLGAEPYWLAVKNARME